MLLMNLENIAIAAAVLLMISKSEVCVLFSFLFRYIEFFASQANKYNLHTNFSSFLLPTNRLSKKGKREKGKGENTLSIDF